MKMKKNINSILLSVLAFTTCVTFSETFSKLTSKFSNLAWVTKFTDLILGEDVFVIEDGSYSSGKQFGIEEAIRVPSSKEYQTMTEEEYDEMVENIKNQTGYTNFPDSLPSYTDFQQHINNAFSDEENASGGVAVTGGSNSYDGYYYVSQSQFEKLKDTASNADNFAQTNTYALGNIGTKGFTFSNYSDNPMLVIFNLYYYLLEIDSSSTSISCGVYNYTKHEGQVSIDSDHLLKCEFVNQVDSKFNFYKSTIANAESLRTGDGKQVRDGGFKIFGSWLNPEWYYPYHSIVNAYNIKKDPDLKTHYSSMGTVGQGFDQTSSVDLKFSLSDFILPPDKKNYIFNLNIYCGPNFGDLNKTSLDYSFVAGIEITTIAINEGDEIDVYVKNNESSNYDYIWNR